MAPARRVSILRAAAGALLVAALTGCTTEQPAPTVSTSTPRAFPRSVPLLPGRVLGRSTTSAEWHVWIATTDPLRGYREARSLLVGAGFVITKDREARGGGDGQLCTELLCVGITGEDDPVYGPSVAYEVFRPSGVT